MSHRLAVTRTISYYTETYNFQPFNFVNMKAIGFFVFLCVSLHSVHARDDEELAVSSDKIKQMLLQMPIKSMDYYSERFYPETIKALNSKHNLTTFIVTIERISFHARIPFI